MASVLCTASSPLFAHPTATPLLARSTTTRYRVISRCQGKLDAANLCQKSEARRHAVPASIGMPSLYISHGILASMFAGLVVTQPAMASSFTSLTDYTDAQVTEGFVQGLLLIFFSELGDKTFFIALLLALQRPKSSVFVGTFGALAIMTVISVALGQALHQLDELVPASMRYVPWDDVLAVILLVVFGIQTIQNAANAEENAAEEKEEAEEEVKTLTAASAGLILSTFALVFAAEWGDKSFLATIALAAATSPVGVTFGAITGHGAATALAVLGGGILSKNVSESVLQYAGGALFLVFAAISTADIVQKMQMV